MELNCIHNITIQVRKLFEENKISREAANKIEDALFLADKYLTAWNHNKEIKWHEILKNPLIYPTQSQYNEKMFMRLKALPNVGDIIKVTKINDEQGYVDMILEENPNLKSVWSSHDDKYDPIFRASTYFNLESRVTEVKDDGNGDWFIRYEVNHPKFGLIKLLEITHIEYDAKECWKTVEYEIIRRI